MCVNAFLESFFHFAVDFSPWFLVLFVSYSFICFFLLF